MPQTQPQPELQTRDLTCRELSLRAASINEEERSFEAVVTSETPAIVFDYRNYEYIEEVLRADGAQFPESIVLLDDHNRYMGSESVIGSATAFRKEGDKWVGRGVVANPADDTDPVRRIWSRLKEGHIRAVSIGYQVQNYVDIPAGQTQTIQGRKYTAKDRKLRVTTQFRVHELSLTPIGADSEALIRKQQGQPAQKRRSIFR